MTALGIAVGACGAALPLAWLVARTDMPFGRAIRSLVTASFVTPPFLGAIAVLGITLLFITFAVMLIASRLPMLGRAPPGSVDRC